MSLVRGSDPSPGAGRRTRGFSLVEVLVALIIIAVGMLGIAKMHALALSSTGSAGTRSLVAIETAGLAASMHADRDYWSTTSTLAYNVTYSPATGVGVDVFPATQSCSTTCTNQQMAAYDLQQFGLALSQIVPAFNANVTCQNTTAPQSCVITVTWLENLAGVSSQTDSAAISSASVTASGATGNANLLQQPQYSLYLEP